MSDETDTDSEKNLEKGRERERAGEIDCKGERVRCRKRQIRSERSRRRFYLTTPSHMHTLQSLQRRSWWTDLKVLLHGHIRIAKVIFLHKKNRS